MMPTQFCVMVAAIGLSALTHPAQAERMDDPAARCEALGAADFSTLLDAPTHLSEAKWVAQSGESLGVCQVSGSITPSVGFMLRLPSEWNGKLIELGCGGTCGTLGHIVGCEAPLRRGYACIVTDGGHQVGGLKWAYNNPRAEIDFAYRATHVTALAGKALVERYYREPPKRSYFEGCSGGGRDALIAAQRFPWDFDGIIAGDPSLAPMGNLMNRVWAHRALQDPSGQPLLGQADLERLHRAVIERCDGNDGIEDGLIGDPQACSFDPEELRCGSAKNAACLTAEQIAAVKKIYGGARTSRGESLFVPVVKGSELGWGSPGLIAYTEEWLRYGTFDPDPGPTWRLVDFDFDRDPKRLGHSLSLYSATNPDLRRFKAAGGKLLMYVGWGDTAQTPLGGVDYYETTERTMGGRAATQAFFRLFALPGQGHCESGAAVKWLEVLEAWVERGEAPDKLIAEYGQYQGRERHVEFTRPVYPYPTRVKYLGRGDPKAAVSFGSVVP